MGKNRSNTLRAQAHIKVQNKQEVRDEGTTRVTIRGKDPSEWNLARIFRPSFVISQTPNRYTFTVTFLV